MSEFNEPWKVRERYHQPEIYAGPGELTIAGCDFDPEYPENGEYTIPDMETAKRIAACVNFCREFPTEWLTDRALIKLTGTPADENVFKMFSAVGLYPTQETQE